MIFSKEQEQVIEHTEGPALVLAGPGSGKTTVITHRLIRLLEKIPEARLICLTFSKAAALEMKNRFRALSKEAVNSVHFATVHSLAYSILKRKYSGNSLPRLLGSKDCPFDKYDILQKIYRLTNGNALPLAETEKLLSWISRARNGTLKRLGDSPVQIKNFEIIKNRYETYKKNRNLIDFDDMMSEALRILRDEPAQRAYWSALYQFVQVDEGQDLSAAQLDLVQFLAPHGNLLIVADDDQSIYGFRGAAPENIINFTKNSACIQYILSNNYRCAPEIVALSSYLIQKNQIRLSKKYTSREPSHGRVLLLHTKNTYGQGFYTVQDIKRTPCDSFGILYRNNHSALPLAAILIRNNLSFQISDATIQPYWDYIHLFLTACVKWGQTNSRLPALYRAVLRKGFAAAYESQKDIHEPENEKILEIAQDILYTLFQIGQNIEDIRRLLTEIMNSLETGYYRGSDSCTKKIFLSTIHSAKGLEYDAVYLISVNKDEFPGKSASTGTLLEEERRLFYVGLTRAKKFLTILFTEHFGGRPAEESIFYREAKAAVKERI